MYCSSARSSRFNRSHPLDPPPSRPEVIPELNMSFPTRSIAAFAVAVPLIRPARCVWRSVADRFFASLERETDLPKNVIDGNSLL
jgi:hypothetical protein